MKEQKSIFEVDNMYKKRNWNQEVNDWNYEPISNFIIKLNFVISSENVAEYHCLLVNTKNKSAFKVFKSSDFNNKHSFKKALTVNTIEYSFWGSDRDVEYVKMVIAEKESIKKYGLEFSGFFKSREGEWLFLDSTSCIDKNGNRKDCYVVLNDYNIGTLFSSDVLTQKEANIILPSLLKFNISEVAETIIFTVVSFFLKERLKHIGIKIPHLAIYGLPGSGKSETIDYIISLFFENVIPQSAEKLKQFGSLKMSSCSNITPIIIEEYKEHSLNINQINLISNLLRSMYDGHESVRGRADQSIVKYLYRSPLIIVGETGINENAIKERTMEVMLSKNNHNDFNLAHFTKIKNNRGLIKKLSKSIILKVLNLTDKEIKDFYDSCVSKIDVNLESRVKSNIASASLGYYLLDKIYKDFGIENIGFESVLANLVNSQVKYNLDYDGYTVTVLDRTLSLIDTMIEMGELVPGDDFVIRNHDFCLRVNQFYVKFTRFIKNNHIKDEFLSKKSDFVKQIKETSYFLKSNDPVWFTWDCSKNKVQKKCMIIDFDEMVHRLDIDVDKYLCKDQCFSIEKNYLNDERVSIESESNDYKQKEILN